MHAEAIGSLLHGNVCNGVWLLHGENKASLGLPFLSKAKFPCSNSDDSQHCAISCACTDDQFRLQSSALLDMHGQVLRLSVCWNSLTQHSPSQAAALHEKAIVILQTLKSLQSRARISPLEHTQLHKNFADNLIQYSSALHSTQAVVSCTFKLRHPHAASLQSISCTCLTFACYCSPNVELPVTLI